MRAFCVLVLLTAVVTATAVGEQQRTLKLGSVDVVGAKRYTAADVAKLAGLTAGQPITPEGLTQAAERLGQSGLFKTLAFKYVTKGDLMSVTFEFEEADWTLPVRFDNFVWFTDEEVRNAVHEGLPTFDGVVPAAEGVPDLISEALQSLLKRRALTGRIHFTPQADLKGNVLGYVFSVRDPAPKVCAVRIEGAAAIATDQLTAAVPLVGKDYSRVYTDNSAKGTLRDLYRQQGYWAADFAPATGVWDIGCGGVIVTLRVTEGIAYAWERAEWTGNAALTSAELSGLLDLKGGDIASLRRIEDGLRAVRRAYGKRGYIIATTSHAPRLDSTARSAIFDVRVAEGPQFRFGNVEFVGFSDSDAAALRKRWQLASGAVFDDSYPATFFGENIQPALQRTGGARQVETQLRPDATTRVVDVRYVLK